ncbi:MAG: hypothetical protein IPK70_07890 [Flavobacteriales bacterium]|nr:hypothetical protein [Flavobacteriales bacterium]
MSVYSRRVQDQTRSEDWLLIEIPRPLLWHPGMSYELLAFMLLHEIGHGLEASATVRSFCSEALADHWAAHVALPALYGAEAAAGMRIRIARQFESYLRSVYTEASHARSTCSREAVKGYPAMDCRIQGILDPLFMDRNAMTENDYPDSCWSSPECEPVVNDSAVWPSGACTNGLNCIAYESHLLCNDPRLELTVESAAASFIEDLFSLCATRPDICSQKQRQSGKGNTTVMDARRLERMLRRARKRLDPIKGRSDEAVKRR